MPEFLPRYKSGLYKEFQSINKQSHSKLIAFFERNRVELEFLDFDHYFDLLTDYADALFETGYYHKYLDVADDLLQCSISHNIIIYKGKDLYKRTLFRKAAAFFNLHQYNQAEYLLAELIKIDPINENAQRFYQKVLYKLGNPILHHSRSLFVFLVLIAALITGVELLFIRPFYAEWIQLFESSRNMFFIGGILFLAMGDLGFRMYNQHKVFHIVKRIKQSKQKRSPNQ